MKDRKIVIFCVLAAIVFSVVLIAYFASQISAVYPPMKTYNFSLTTDQLRNKIINIANDDTNLSYKITDSTGTSKDDLNYYVDVYLKNNLTLYTFNIFYNKSDNKHSEINLVGAFDNIHKFGGYQNNSKEMQDLITIFENNFIYRINYNQ